MSIETKNLLVDRQWNGKPVFEPSQYFMELRVRHRSAK